MLSYFIPKLSKKNDYIDRKTRSLKYEQKILETQGFQVGKNVWIHDVPLTRKGEHIHTIEAGRGNSEKLVLIHGYGGAGVSYWKVMAQLSKKFHVFAIDQLGQGNSARPQLTFDPKNHKKATKFFSDAIEDWRTTLNITDFSIVGHSMGAATAAHYVKNKNPNIKKLFLFSPAGFTSRTRTKILELAKTQHKFNFLEISVLKAAFYLIHNFQYTPVSFMKLVGKQRALKHYYNSPTINLTPEESYLFWNFADCIQGDENNSNQLLGAFTYWGIYCRNPVVDALEELHNQGNLPETYVYYGAQDLMDFEHSQQVIREKNLSLSVNYKILMDTNHQMVVTNPCVVAREISNAFELDFALHDNEKEYYQNTWDNPWLFGA